MAMILLLDLDYFKHLGDSSRKLNFTSLERNERKEKYLFYSAIYQYKL